MTLHVHNDLSKKVIYLCYYQTKSLEKLHAGNLRGTHAHDFFKMISFDNNRDIQPSSISHYARVTSFC